MDTFREVEASQKVVPSVADKAPKILDNMQQKELEKTEKKIQELERKIKTLHDKMMSDDFYNSPDYERVSAEYNSSQALLDEEMEKMGSNDLNPNNLGTFAQKLI
jgi:predicted translin family RNA/ssDNA-binding protein